ncbi:glucosyltransferase domain-containing protein [Myxococcus sp. K15C18031901]|uniref:glucosyltransferase domain-containing protein n=1 Tax=Myxococcus dinghuensis TaxID=2906761 RepID=UPI0020A80BB1|nr:glucosyltransferase domain-containing protein [Myxococcus dinghuensis]MCP3100237.1 glucosyltransferase domain-containing protein [Myxococcus dinghuensis]
MPWAIYAGAISHHYGLRDDYSILREAREEPGKILRVCGAMGRPLYGWLLERSTREAEDIQGLSGMRAMSVAGLGLLSVAVFLVLRREGWRGLPATLLAALLGVIPSAQVVASWSICWPQPVAMLCAVAAFALARRGLEAAPEEAAWRRRAWCLGGVVALGASTLIYQASAPFFVVLLAAALVARVFPDPRAVARTGLRYLLVMGGGLGLAYAVTRLTFALGVFTPSPRMAFERHLLDKTDWFVTRVLPNALALIELNDTDAAPSGGYWPMVGFTLLLVAAGLFVEWRRAGRVGLLTWLGALGGLSAAAFCVSFLAGERWPTYRTLYALTGVWCVFFVAAAVRLGDTWPRTGPRVAAVLLTSFVALGALLAHQQSQELFVQPQLRELALMREGADAVVPSRQSRVFVLTARQADSSASQRYLDEFGSVSVDTEWVAKELFQALVRERFPQERDVRRFYRFAAGPVLPERRAYDVLVDMRQQRPAPSRPIQLAR